MDVIVNAIVLLQRVTTGGRSTGLTGRFQVNCSVTDRARRSISSRFGRQELVENSESGLEAITHSRAKA